MYKNTPLPEDQQLNNLGLFIESKWLSRILFMDFLYKQIVETQGVVMEFGTHWGQNSALFTTLRGIYEPFNRHRKIIGFDTFKGFPSINKNDGDSDCEGDASIELEKYLNREKHTVIALAYFDFDLYEPTKRCLELIKDRITKGSIIGFDEVNDPDSPGETLALMETMGLNNIKLKRYKYCSRVSYFEVE